MRFNRHQPPQKSVAKVAASPRRASAKPTRTGYEKYKDPGYIPDLQVDPSLWGTAARPPSMLGGYDGGQGIYDTRQNPQSSVFSAPVKKMMSLEEVEAAMRAQPKKPSSSQIPQQPPQMPVNNVKIQHPHLEYRTQHKELSQTVESLKEAQHERPDQYYNAAPGFPRTFRAELPAQVVGAPKVSVRSQGPVAQPVVAHDSGPPRQILQNPKRQHPQQTQVDPTPVLQPQPQPIQVQQRPLSASLSASSHQLPIITHPQQLMHLSENERAAFLVEDAKRAKRNHKIYLLSKDNGLMTPQDKNFITRIQLQQLMTATSSVSDQNPDAALSEDFYYQVHSQIRGGPRQTPHQPLSHFAQTYLFQTGGRQGAFARRQNRGGDNHMQRMEQQVQRAVEAAKLKPKNKQLVIEGSLGKISFSNAKTPKPLLNIKRTEGGDATNRPQSAGRQASAKNASKTELSPSDRKTILKNIERVYSTLMEMEDHERRLPPTPTEESDAIAIQDHMEWRHNMQLLNQKLWSELKVMEPINPGSTIPHPFIAFLSYSKGKKAIPRIFRHIDLEQRVTILTIIVVHLDILEVIRGGQLQPGDSLLPTAIREEIELFSQAVMPSLFGYVNEAPLNIIIGLLGLILNQVNVQAVARTKVGLNILTMIISRAELVKQTGTIDDQEWEQWSVFYNRLFDVLESSLGVIFPGSINAGEDMYVWQFLAAIGIGATPEQQQRLVLAVKYVVSLTCPPYKC